MFLVFEYFKLKLCYYKGFDVSMAKGMMESLFLTLSGAMHPDRLRNFSCQDLKNLTV